MFRIKKIVREQWDEFQEALEYSLNNGWICISIILDRHSDYMAVLQKDE